MRRDVLRADADDPELGLQQVLVQVTEAAGFLRAPGREVRGVEIEDQRTVREQ
jgi:hypothetical protein